MKLIKKILCWLLILVILPLPLFVNTASAQTHFVSVKLQNYLGNVNQLTIHIHGSFSIKDDSKNSLKSGNNYTVRLHNGKVGLYQGSTLINSYNRLTLTPVPYSTSNYISINNRKYLGETSFVVENGAYIRPINVLPLEDYLKGVVPREMPASYHLEALKSQSTAARTYVMRRINSTITDTQTHQVYGGFTWQDTSYERNGSSKAVDATAGQVLRHNNSLIDAVYSSSNGGYVESNSGAWGTAQLAYLPAKADPFDTYNKFSFTINQVQIDLSKENLEKPEQWWGKVKEKDANLIKEIKTLLFNQMKYPSDSEAKIASIDQIKLLNQTAGQRTNTIEFSITYYYKSKSGYQLNGEKKIQPLTAKVTMTSSKLRSIIGSMTMMSNYLNQPTLKDGKFTLSGQGFGHGVGLSQQGAQNRAANGGQSYQQILSFYYPGAALSTISAPAIPKPGISGVKVSPEKVTDPNNAKVSLSYSLDKDAIVSLRIIDKEGKTVATPMSNQSYSKGNKSLTWDAKNLKKGTYTLEVEARDLINQKTTSKKNFSVDLASGDKTENPPPSQATEKLVGTVKVSSSLNVRSGAGTGHSIIGSLKNGQKVDIIKQHGSWYEIKYGSGKGYVHGDYLTVSKVQSGDSGSGNNTTPAPSKQMATVHVSTSLNVRKGAGTNHAIIGSLKPNQRVEIIKKHGSWYEIKYGNSKGFVHGDYLKIEKASSGNSGGNQPPSVSTPPNSNQVRRGTVQVSTSLNIRSAPSTTATIVGSLRNGASVEILSTSGDWHTIKHSNKNAYVHKAYIK